MARFLLLLVLVPVLAGCASSPPSNAFTAVTFEHSYVNGAKETRTFSVPAGGARVSYSVLFKSDAQSGARACAPSDDTPRILVQEPSGATWRDEKLSAYAVSTGDGGCGETHNGADLAAGPWTITFTGRGLLSGLIAFEQG